MNIPFIDLKAQQELIKSDILNRIENVLAHGRYIMGPEVTEAEAKLADFVGTKHCITVASGTEALLISLMAINIKPGDEVITTAFTFAATAEVIALLGAKPVFVDIDPKTCNIDTNQIKEAISNKTKAIIPVSLYGQPSDMDEINSIVAGTEIKVIEDAAQSLGSIYKGKNSGNLSHIGCTSFFPSKPLGCYGDGGAIFTNDEIIAEASRQIRVHGQSKRYTHTRIGVGGRMDTMQCAVVLSKLSLFPDEVKKRQEIGNYYTKLFSEAPNKHISLIETKSDRTNVFAQYTIRVSDRERMVNALKEKGIPTAVHYPIPLNEQEAYKNISKSFDTTQAKAAAKEVVSLPMHPYLEKSVQESIVKTVLSVFS